MSKAYNRTIKPTSGYSGTPSNKQQKLDGIYIAKIKDNRDVRMMGRLRVWVPQLSSDENDENGWVLVSYASPFAGATNVRKNTNANTYEATQKSYGFWAVPPDINVQVLVCFADGDTAKGFWFACLYDEQMNFMVPGIPSDDDISPKAEYNRKIDGEGRRENPNRPAHTPVETTLKEQGLETDKIRGLNSSSARRRGDSGNSKDPKNLDTHYYNPSKVYGWLTPGGHQVVLDDGYDNGETHSLIRFRTRHGSQILVDDTQGVMYLITQNGKIWIELSEKNNQHNLDVYSMGNISFHAEKGNINLKAGNNLNIQTGKNINVRSDGESKWYSKKNMDIKTDKEFTVESLEDMYVKSSKNLFTETSESIHFKAGESWFSESNNDMNLKTNAVMRQESSDVFNIKSSANVYVTGSEIRWNDPREADSAISAEPSSPAEIPITYRPPGPAKKESDIWNPGKEYEEELNIIPRVPQHEPWELHTYTTPVKTKAEITPPVESRRQQTSAPAQDTGRTQPTENRTSAPAQDTGRTQPAENRSSAPKGSNAPSEAKGAGNTPVTGQISGKNTSLSEEETQAYKDVLGQRESSGDYTAENSLGYVGKYQFGAAALEDTGYLKQGTVQKYNSAGLDPQDAISDPSNWTGKGNVRSKEDFLANPAQQERAMDNYTSRNLRSLENLGVVNANTPKADVAGYLGAAHLGGPGGAQALANGNVRRDAYGSGTSEYFDLGASSINQLYSEGSYQAAN